MKQWWKDGASYDEIPRKYQEAIDCYIDTGNQTEAFSKVAKAGISRDNISSQASLFFRDARVVDLVRERRDQILRASRLTPEQIIQRITDIAEGRVEDQFSPKTSVKDRHDALKTLAKITGVLDESSKTQVNVGIQFVDDVNN